MTSASTRSVDYSGYTRRCKTFPPTVLPLQQAVYREAMACEVHITEAGRRLGVSAKYLRQLERLGRIPAARRDQFGARTYSAFDISLLKAIGVGSKPRKLRCLEEVLEVVR